MVKSLFLTEKIGYPGKVDTALLISESARRFDTYYCEPHELFMENGKVKANIHKVSVKKNGELAADEKTSATELDNGCLITVRINPPFDGRYISAMYMLRELKGSSYVTNNPQGIINMPEKFIPRELIRYAPATLITTDERQMIAFWKKHKDVIIKPLYEFAGRGVFRMRPDDGNYKTVLNLLREKYNEPLIVQKYIPEIRKGDKRIGIIEGEIAGAFLRVPPKNQVQAAVALGADFIKCEITATEKKICEILKPILKKQDIFYCGIDVIGDQLTEINVTCPAHFWCYNELYKNDKGYVPAEKTYWNALEEKLRSSKLLVTTR
jgi:glutathione synthase